LDAGTLLSACAIFVQPLEGGESKTAQFVTFFAAQDVDSLAVVPLRLLDPRKDRSDARFELPREVLGASPSSMQLDDLFQESRRVRVPCSWHVNTFPFQSEGVYETGGTPQAATPLWKQRQTTKRIIPAARNAGNGATLRAGCAARPLPPTLGTGETACD
jgi:hypothetical protein